jgi:hypothetical protein
MRIRNQNPAFSHIITDPDYGQTLPSQKVEFFMKLVISFLCSFLSTYLVLVRMQIRIPNTDPDPGESNQCRSIRIRIRIYNNGLDKTAALSQNTRHSLV